MAINGKTLGTVGVAVAALALGFWKFGLLNDRIYSESNDVLKVVSSVGMWDMTVHNTGPDTTAVVFWYSKTTKQIYCLEKTFFSADERREITSYCSEMADIDDAEQWVLTTSMYENANWRDADL